MSSLVILLKLFILSSISSEPTSTLDNAVFIIPIGVSDDALIDDIIVFLDDSINLSDTLPLFISFKHLLINLIAGSIFFFSTPELIRRILS